MLMGLNMTKRVEELMREVEEDLKKVQSLRKENTEGRGGKTLGYLSLLVGITFCEREINNLRDLLINT